MTSFPRLPTQSEPPLSPRQTLPTMYDLPDEDPEELYLPDHYHGHQPQILEETFQPSEFAPLSYVIWQEEANPFVVVELLSPSTEAEDLGRTLPQRSNNSVRKI